jgi:RNA polymerase sigma-70 factor (ECF subfamily)
MVGMERGETGSGTESKDGIWRYGAEVRRLAGQLCQHREDAEDVAQSTLLKAATNIEGFRREASVRTWLHRIATNECRQLRRRRVPASLDQLLESSWLDQASPMDHARVADPEEYAIEAELRQAVLIGLGALPPAERAVLLLRDGRGLRIREISELTSSTEVAVRSRVYRARRHLRQLLAQRLGPMEDAPGAGAATNEELAHL